MDVHAMRINVMCVIGILLSLYAGHVAHESEHNHNYKALCDIHQYVSCTKVLTSKYGRGFGIQLDIAPKNSSIGLLYYFLVAVLGIFRKNVIVQTQLYLIVVANIASLFLAYLLVFELHDFCIVCVLSYVVNLLSLIYSYQRFNYYKKEISAMSQSNKPKDE